MDSGVIFPICRNGCTSPFLRNSSLAPTTGSFYQYSRKPLARRSSLISWPRAASRDFGAVEDLPDTNRSFYELLGIPANGSYDDIKRTYKHLARKYHPDVSPQDRMKECTQLFTKVNEAYGTLSDPVRRALYDHHLAQGHQLSFSTGTHFDQGMEEKSWWLKHAEVQLVELSRRSTRKYSDGNLSWGARMRRRNADSYTY